MRAAVIGLVFVGISLVPCTGSALRPARDLRSLAGESLEFRIRWGIIPAGKATLEVLDAGEGQIRFMARARTLPYIDAIYPVRDRVESTLLLPQRTALRYYKRSQEGWGPAKEVEVLFDTRGGTARYSRNGKPQKTIPVPKDVQDPLSCFYIYRTLDLPSDADVRLKVTDGKKLITGVVSVLGRETVETPAGRFATVIVEPKMEGIGGIFKRSPGARILIWLTDDEWRRPVKLRSQVVVGHFTAELVRIGGPGTASGHPRRAGRGLGAAAFRWNDRNGDRKAAQPPAPK